jgi:beta-lactamase regulating signal transducer with metallopeptidase domain
MEAIINNLIKAIGWSILHSLWQGAIIFAVLFITLSLYGKASAKLKHNLSMVSLLLIFVGFCLTFAALFNLPTKASSGTELTLNAATLQQFYSFSDSWTFKTERYFPLVVSMYVLGISFQLLVLISGYIKLKQLKSSAVSVFPEAWLNTAEETLNKLRISKKVKFYLSEKVNVPLAVGFVKPVVLFPVALVTQLEIKQVEAILIHELSHIRRNDYLLNLLKTGIETVLFFNPFVWLTSRFIHIEREHACDDLVVELTGAPVAYAHTLLKLELIRDKSQPALSLAATGKNQHLYQRIKRITNMKTTYMNVKQKALALCLTLTTVISLAWINPTENKNEDTNPQAIKTTTVKQFINSIAHTHKQLYLKADTDTVKKKKTFKAIIKDGEGNNVVYHSLDEMPDSMRIKFERLEQQFNSPEWKDKMVKIAFDMEKMEKMFKSPEWNDKMTKMNFDMEKMEKMFNSPEWKENMAKIELKAKDMEKMLQSPEWKDKMAKIEFHAKEMEKKLNSPEWKEKMKDIEQRSKELSEKFNSPEWQKKMQELKELHNSKEYKELREKYERDLEELKKKKGISSEKALLLLDVNMPLQLAAQTLNAQLALTKVLPKEQIVLSEITH